VIARWSSTMPGATRSAMMKMQRPDAIDPERTSDLATNVLFQLISRSFAGSGLLVHLHF